MIASRFISTLLAAAAAACLAGPALADPDKDESGHGRRGHGYGDHRGGHGHQGREYKEEFWDGACKVERKVDKKGGYKEERKCAPNAGRHGAPVYGPAPAPGVYVQPPAVVIQPPGVVIR